MTFFSILQLASLSTISLSIFSPKKWRRRILVSAVAVFFLVPAFRWSYIRFHPSPLRYESIGKPPWYMSALDSLLDERDLVKMGLRAYIGYRPATPPLEGDFQKLYDSLIRENGLVFPSPMLTTLFSLQTAEHFQLLSFRATEADAKPAIFLHGIGGNYTVQCWMIAAILKPKGYTTYCPATRFLGDWWSDESLPILSQTIDHVKVAHPGKQILYLGLSNGAVGLMKHAENLAKPDALILISGGQPKVGSLPARTLVLWGEQDDILPYQVAQMMKAMSPIAITLKSFQSDHFLLVRRHDEVGAAILEFLAGKQ